MKPKSRRPAVVYEPGHGPEEEKRPAQPDRDPKYAPDAPVNRQPVLTYAEAMGLRERGELGKAVLTEKGWVLP